MPLARIRHRRGNLRPLRRQGEDCRQRRRTAGHRRHPRPLRETWRVAAGALPAGAARTADGSRVTSRWPRRRGRKLEDDTIWPRPAGLRWARCRVSMRNGHARPAVGSCAAPQSRNPTRGRRNLRPRGAQTGACAIRAYPADCREGAFEFPVPRRYLSQLRSRSSLGKSTPSEFAATPRDDGTLANNHPSHKLANKDSTK